MTSFRIVDPCILYLFTYNVYFVQIAAFLDDIYKETTDELSATENIESDPCMEKTEM